MGKKKVLTISKKLLIIILLLFCNCSFNKNFIKPVKDTSWKVISNENVQKEGSTFLFLWSQYDEATADAVQFRGTYGASKDLWHLYKNQGKFKLMASMGLKGLSIGQENTTISQTCKRFFFECLTAWVIWHLRYRYVKYGTPFEYSAYANQHAIYIPNPWTDSYIGLEGSEVVMFDLLRLSIGIYGLIKY